MKRKQLFITFMLCTALVISACGAGASNNIESADNMSTSIIDEQSAEALSGSSAENSENASSEFSETTEVIPSVEEPSEEDLYWLSMIENEFKDSKYDLREALVGPALKDYCEKYFSLGVGINGSTLENQTLNLPEYMTVAKKHFNSVTMTNLMKSCYILDQKGSIASLETGDGSPVLNFSSIDPTLQWCMDNSMKMRGHTLVWHAQAPEWFFREGYSEQGAYVDKETMLFRMESYIKQMLTHVQDNYPGVIYCWDVVNEAVDPDKGDKESGFYCRTENEGTQNPWYMTIGPDYVEMAFTYARQYAAEDVKLFYNDFNTFMPYKKFNIIKLCSMLKEKNLIDGIGMQGYWGINYPGISTIDSAIKAFAELDLEIQITELSISVEKETEEQFELQAKEYGRVFASLSRLDKENGGPANITNVTFFGLIDHYREGDTTNTRLFDKEYQPKAAFNKVKEMLQSLYTK